MKTLLVFALLCGVAFAALSEQEQFNNWMQEHGKIYTPEEKSRRFSIFKDNIKMIAELNAEGGAEFGLNKFADMSPREFKETVLMNPIEYENNEQVAGSFEPFVGAPATFDWRDSNGVTPVKDQGQCGSCWAFSATEAIESAWILAGHSNSSTIKLAPQQIVDCDTKDSGCNGGWPETAYEYVQSAGGQEGEAHYAYTAKDGKCAFNAQYVEAKVAAYKSATTNKDEATLQNNLVSWGPLSICVDAAKWQTYKSGVLSPTQCCILCELDHCVQLVGYNSTANPPFWMVRNSWGTGWGVNGYIHLEMGGNTCGLTKHATWPNVL